MDSTQVMRKQAITNMFIKINPEVSKIRYNGVFENSRAWIRSMIKLDGRGSNVEGNILEIKYYKLIGIKFTPSNSKEEYAYVNGYYQDYENRDGWCESYLLCKRIFRPSKSGYKYGDCSSYAWSLPHKKRT